jgi:cytoskeletal protein RodZ
MQPEKLTKTPGKFMIYPMPEQEDKQVDANKTESTPSKKGSNKKLIIIIAIVVGVIAILGVGSYAATRFFAEEVVEKAAEQATGGKVDIEDEGDKVTIETDEGTATIGKNEVPDSFPSDVTVYSDAEITATSETASGTMINLETSDSVSKVFDFYKSNLASNGWKQTSAATYAGTATVTAEKGGKMVSVIIGTDTDNNKTTIIISVNDL